MTQNVPVPRLSLRMQHTVFVVLFLLVIGLLAVVSSRYVLRADWTAAGRYTLHPASITLLGRLVGRVQVTVFVSDSSTLWYSVMDFLAQYHRYKPDFLVTAVNPETAPNRARLADIHADGEVVLEYQGHSEHLTHLTEQVMADALERLLRGSDHLIVFLQGHGERDLSAFAQTLQEKGLRVMARRLALHPQLPENTDLVILTEPQVDWLPGEVTILQHYLDLGGNVLWLSAPPAQGSLHGLEPLAQSLGVRLPPGVVVDPAAMRLFGVASALGTQYASHPVTQEFDLVTLFPAAAMVLTYANAGGWHALPLVESNEESWLAVGATSDAPTFAPGVDTRGPLPLGVALTRPVPSAPPTTTPSPPLQSSPSPPPHPENEAIVSLHREQRVAVFGGGNFLSDSVIGNGGNLALGLNLVDWLVYDEDSLNLPARVVPDRSLRFSPAALLIMAGGFLVVLPLTFFGIGGVVWWRRRH